MGEGGSTWAPGTGERLNSPTLRAISLPKSVWEQETSFLHAERAGRRESLPGSTQAGEWPGGVGSSRLPLPEYRSVFGMPMLSCCTPSYRAWSLVILLLDLTYSAFLLPITIGFQVNDLEWTWACFLDLVVGAFFAAELYLGFHASFVANSGERKSEVWGARAVARYYVRRGSFWQDLVSTAIWVTQIVLLALTQSGTTMPRTVNAFQFVRVIRMVRFFSVMRVLFRMTITSGNSTVLPGLRLRVSPPVTHSANILYAGLVAVNFFACLWNFIAIEEGFDNTWMNSIGQLVRQYSADGASMLTPEELAAVPGPRRWLTAFYWTLVTASTLGYGDIVPSTAAETAVDCVVVAVAVLAFGIILGSIAEQVANSSREARQAQMYRRKIALVKAWTKAAGMPKELRAKINSYYADVWVKHASEADTAQLFFELPHKLRQEIAWEMNRAAFDAIPFFAHVDQTMRFVLSSFMALVELTPGQELALRGDIADRFWILHEGEVQVANSEGDTMRTIYAPAVVGETALLQHYDTKYSIRPHGYMSLGGCSLWEVLLADLMPFLLSHPEVLDALLRSARCRLTRESICSLDVMSEGSYSSRGPLQLFAAGPPPSLAEGSEEGEEDELRAGEVFSAAQSLEPSEGSSGSWGGGSREHHATLEFAADEAEGRGPCQQGSQGFPGAGSSFPPSPFAASIDPLNLDLEEAPGAAGHGGHWAGSQHHLDCGGGAGAQLGSAGGGAIQLTVDAWGEAAALHGGGWQDAGGGEAAGGAAVEEEQEPGDPAAPVTKGELDRAVARLQEDIMGRLEELAQTVQHAARSTAAHTAVPLWAVAAGDARRRSSARQLFSDRRGIRVGGGSPSPASRSPSAHNLKWAFGQLAAEGGQ